jgi:hypothetical protein
MPADSLKCPTSPDQDYWQVCPTDPRSSERDLRNQHKTEPSQLPAFILSVFDVELRRFHTSFFKKRRRRRITK